MIKALPSTWDETIVLPGSSIGEVAAFARRKGDQWFVAVLNGLEARTLRVELKFLGPRSYNSTLVRDDPDNAAAERIERAMQVAPAAAAGDIVGVHVRADGNVSRCAPD